VLVCYALLHASLCYTLEFVCCCVLLLLLWLPYARPAGRSTHSPVCYMSAPMWV
jgi:hypothetical protein